MFAHVLSTSCRRQLLLVSDQTRDEWRPWRTLKNTHLERSSECDRPDVDASDITAANHHSYIIKLLCLAWSTDQQATVASLSEFSGPKLVAHWKGNRIQQEQNKWQQKILCLCVCAYTYISPCMSLLYTITIVVKQSHQQHMHAHIQIHTHTHKCICVYSRTSTTIGRGRCQKPVFCLCLYSTLSTICRNGLLLFWCTVWCSTSMTVLDYVCVDV